MSAYEDTAIYVLGGGAVGIPLAAFLQQAGRRVVLVRTSQSRIAKTSTPVVISYGAASLTANLETISLDELPSLKGLFVITTKAGANTALAAQLSAQAAGPVLILQNGLEVERPFLDAGFTEVVRVVLYVTSQRQENGHYQFRCVSPSAAGLIAGSSEVLEQSIKHLSTPPFPFESCPDINREVWQKAIINAAFNSICPLLEVDNGIFSRSSEIAQLASEVIAESLVVASGVGVRLSHENLMQKLLQISRISDGQLISTYQDIRAGRETEMDFLNPTIARIGASLTPPVLVPTVALLGRLTLAKSRAQLR